MNTRSLLTNPIFARARSEIEALELHISENNHVGSAPYLVICGRSNQRWWLIPRANHKLAVSGLALFQPVLASAKIIKTIAGIIFSVGLSSLWGSKKLHISGKSFLAELFNEEDIYYAFFTGTDSPHRKVAVQIMDTSGRIKGFAKITLNPAVKPLLAHEAETLKHLHTLDLESAHIPVVLFSGERGGARLLVTDTLKTEKTQSAITLNATHLAFLNELALKTATPAGEGDDWLVQRLSQRYESLKTRLPLSWQERFEKSLSHIRFNGAALGPPVLTHGDFTPWNTFSLEDKLYVFDWEYASRGYPAGYDLLHFILSHPGLQRLPAEVQINAVLKQLENLQFVSTEGSAQCLLMTYLCGHALHYASRDPSDYKTIKSWDGMEQAADLLDATLASKTL